MTATPQGYLGQVASLLAADEREAQRYLTATACCLDDATFRLKQAHVIDWQSQAATAFRARLTDSVAAVHRASDDCDALARAAHT
ncbi:MAG: hypothetical protein LBB54_02870 [Cellulomonadaceae bacterium]|jgi:hypothetical protein|nr:hypothetical protein [Cellulomonadaceae bacterium]